MTQAIPRPGPARAARLVPGLLLVAPALLLWLFGLVPPVLSTLYLSVHRVTGLTPDEEFVGAANYTTLFGDGAYGRAAGFTVLTVAVRVAAVAVVPPLLAWGVARLGRWAAIPLGVLFTLPLAFATPAFAAVASRFGTDPGAARVAVLGAGGTYALLYACGIGLVVLTAAVRGGTRAFVVAWAVGLLAAAAYGVQSFTGPSILTAGGPAGSTSTLGLFALTEGLQNLQLGYAAAAEVTFLLPVLLLGLVTGILLITSRTALDPRPAPAATLAGRPAPTPADRPALTSTPAPTPAALIAGGVALLISLVALVRGMAPIVAGWFGRPVTGISTAGALLRVLGHDLPSTVLVVVVALAAASGIVLFRPGRWLLLPFAPWLFLTPVTQGPALFLAYTRGTVQRPFAHLQPALSLLPILLFGFVILLNGLEPRWQAARREPYAFARHVLSPAWPAALGISAAAFLATTHEFVTGWITAPDARTQPLPVAAARAAQSFTAHGTAVTRPDLPLAALLFAALAAAIAWYAGRAVLRTGAH